MRKVIPYGFLKGTLPTQKWLREKQQHLFGMMHQFMVSYIMVYPTPQASFVQSPMKKSGWLTLLAGRLQ